MNNLDRQRIGDYERVDLWLRWIYDLERSPEHILGLVEVFRKTASPHMLQVAERTMMWDVRTKAFWNNYRN
jgi:hypothetical protein